MNGNAFSETHWLTPIRCHRRRMLGLSASLTTGMFGGVTFGSEELANTSDHSVISIFLRGGLSQVDSFDPQPGSAGIDQPFLPRQTRTAGIVFTELYPGLAERSDRITVVRGMTHQESDHTPSQRYWRTGRTDAGSDDPSLGAVVAHHTGWQIPPSYVAIPQLPPDAGFLGASCSAYNVGSSPVGDKTSEAVSIAEQAKRIRRREMLDHLGRGVTQSGANSKSLESLTAARERALSISESPLMHNLSNFGDENVAVVRNYGDTELGRYLLMARRLAAAGSRFVQVETGDWDHHVGLVETFPKQAVVLDRAISGLIDDLSASGLSERVLVMVSTEFGRDPKLDGPTGKQGRGHWSHNYCGLLCGASNDRVSGLFSEPVSPADWWKTAAKWLQIDTDSSDLLPDGRRLNVTGTAIF